MGVCEALCDVALKKGYRKTIGFEYIHTQSMQRNSRVDTLAHLSYPDFGDGVVQATAVWNLPECDGVELSLVEVGHGSVTRLLTQRLGRLQSVLKVIPGPKTVPL